MRNAGVRVGEEMIRTDIGNQEVNFLVRTERNGREVYLVGEAELGLDDAKRGVQAPPVVVRLTYQDAIRVL